MDAPWESPVRRRLRESLPVFGCTITDRQPRHGGAGGDRRVPFPLAGAGALAADARDRAQHRARDARSSRCPVRARAGDRGLERQARARRRRARRGVSVRQHAGPGAAGGGRLPLSARRAPRIRRQPRDRLLAGSRRLLRLRRSQHRRRGRGRAGCRRWPTSTRSPPRPAWTWSSSARATCLFRSGCAGSSSTRASKRRRPPCSPPRAVTARSPDVRRERSTTPAATSTRGFCSSRRRPSWRCSRQAREQFLGPHGIGPARRQRTLY